MKIMNLTQHKATPEQVKAGVVEPADKSAVQAALTFLALPTGRGIVDRAAKLARMARESGAKKAMIGGAPFLMAPLERALASVGVQALYAFSRRESIETVSADGSVRKTADFKHLGFVEAI